MGTVREHRIGSIDDVTRDGERFVMIEQSEAEPPPTQLILVQNWAEELKRLAPTENEN